MPWGADETFEGDPSLASWRRFSSHARRAGPCRLADRLFEVDGPDAAIGAGAGLPCRPARCTRSTPSAPASCRSAAKSSRVPARSRGVLLSRSRTSTSACARKMPVSHGGRAGSVRLSRSARTSAAARRRVYSRHPQSPEARAPRRPSRRDAAAQRFIVGLNAAYVLVAPDAPSRRRSGGGAARCLAPCHREVWIRL